MSLPNLLPRRAWFLSLVLFCSACSPRPPDSGQLIPSLSRAEMLLPELARYELQVDPQQEGFRGKLLIDFSTTKVQDRISLHVGRELTCERWRIKPRSTGEAEGTGEVGTQRALPPRVNQPHYNQERELLELQFSSPLQPGSWQLEASYEGRWSSLPVTRVTEDEDRYLIVHTRAGKGRSLFPGRDDYPSKLSFTIQAPPGIRIVGLGGESQSGSDDLMMLSSH